MAVIPSVLNLSMCYCCSDISWISEDLTTINADIEDPDAQYNKMSKLEKLGYQQCFTNNNSTISNESLTT